MFYPKIEFCPLNSDEVQLESAAPCLSNNTQTPTPPSNDNMESSSTPQTQNELLKKIQEISFAVVDLNLFLDTHSDCTEALELYTKLASTLKSLKADYVSKYGPLCATDSPNKVPFAWVDANRKWPWEI